MRVTVVSAADPVATFEEAVDRLRLGGDESERADIEKMITAATALFDVGSYYGRAIGRQTLELRCDRFTDCDGDPLVLPNPPIIDIVGISYLDGAGVEQDLDNGAYELIGAELWPVYGGSWPSLLSRREAVRITYEAGFDEVPENIKSAILLAVGDMYRFRETMAVASASALPSAGSIDNLLAAARVYG